MQWYVYEVWQEDETYRLIIVDYPLNVDDPDNEMIDAYNLIIGVVSAESLQEAVRKVKANDYEVKERH